MPILPTPVSHHPPFPRSNASRFNFLKSDHVADFVIRKIRCCGGGICGNCAKQNRPCIYNPVPEAVNKATREKKAASKASKHSMTPSTGYTPYSLAAPPSIPLGPAFGTPYGLPSAPPQPPMTRPLDPNQRMVSSIPHQHMQWLQGPPDGDYDSPRMFDSRNGGSWVYTPPQPQNTPGQAQCPPVQFPVPTEGRTTDQPHTEPHPVQQVWATPTMASNGFQSGAQMYTPLTNTQTSNSTSNSTSKSSPATPFYSQGYPTPGYSPIPLQPVHHSNNSKYSPTLAPEYSMIQQQSKDSLIGLGIRFPASSFPVQPQSQAPPPPLQRATTDSDLTLGLHMVDDQFYNTGYQM